MILALTMSLTLTLPVDDISFTIAEPNPNPDPDAYPSAPTHHYRHPNAQVLSKDISFKIVVNLGPMDLLHHVDDVGRHFDSAY